MSKKCDFAFSYCWTGVTQDGALVGGYTRYDKPEKFFRRVQKWVAPMREFHFGPTPIDVLQSLRVHGHITCDGVLAAMKSE